MSESYRMRWTSGKDVSDTRPESKLCSKAALRLQKPVLLGNHVLIGGGIGRKGQRAVGWHMLQPCPSEAWLVHIGQGSRE